MIVALRTGKQATQVAGLTGGVQLAGKPKPDGTPTLSRFVDIGSDFEQHRSVVESVSVLFTLHNGNTDTYRQTGKPGNPLPSGWTLTAVKFEVEWPSDPVKSSLIRSHFGARRKAYNWGLGLIKSELDASGEDPLAALTPWNLAALRKAWNAAKDEVAPWWGENSKEAYSCGLADLEQGLRNWSASRSGQRKGPKVGFPRFSSRRDDPGRVRFTTGAMRLETDRRIITVPVIGGLRSKENTRCVQRHLSSGRARLLNLTLTQRWGRLFVSIAYALRDPNTPHTPKHPTVRAGVDLGVRTLATVSTIDTVIGEQTLTEYPNPAPLRATLAQRRQAGRELSRRIPGSRGYLEATAKLTRLDRRCVNLRREAVHQLTTELTRLYGHIVIEDLDVASMKKSMGRRAFRRAVSDAAMGLFRPMLAYKAARSGTQVTVADRWFPSSQLHHGCYLPDGTQCRLVGKGRIDTYLSCSQTGEPVHRDHNAAPNLRDWPDYASRRTVGATVPWVSTSRSGSGDRGSDPLLDR